MLLLPVSLVFSREYHMTENVYIRQLECGPMQNYVYLIG